MEIFGGSLKEMERFPKGVSLVNLINRYLQRVEKKWKIPRVFGKFKEFHMGVWILNGIIWNGPQSNTRCNMFYAIHCHCTCNRYSGVKN